MDIAVPADFVHRGIQVVEEGAVIGVGGWAIKMDERDSVAFA
jgi:hypothetical protein